MHTIIWRLVIDGDDFASFVDCFGTLPRRVLFCDRVIIEPKSERGLEYVYRCITYTTLVRISRWVKYVAVSWNIGFPLCSLARNVSPIESYLRLDVIATIIDFRAMLGARFRYIPFTSADVKTGYPGFSCKYTTWNSSVLRAIGHWYYKRFIDTLNVFDSLFSIRVNTCSTYSRRTCVSIIHGGGLLSSYIDFDESAVDFSFNGSSTGGHYLSCAIWLFMW